MDKTIHIFQRRQWQPTPVLLPGKSHGRRSLVGCLHGVTKSRAQLSDFTFTFHFHTLEKEMATHSSILAWRISCLENRGRQWPFIKAKWLCSNREDKGGQVQDLGTGNMECLPDSLFF